jgi:hypothetical protein
VRRQVDRDDNRHAATEYNNVRIKVLTEEGREHANVAIPFEKRKTSVINIRARTTQPDGKMVDFDGKTYEQMVEKTKGVKYLGRRSRRRTCMPNQPPWPRPIEKLIRSGHQRMLGPALRLAPSDQSASALAIKNATKHKASTE